MKVGLAFASSAAIDGPAPIEICRRAEDVGFESLWGGEHVIIPDEIYSKYPYTEDGKIPAEPDTPIPDPLIWLAFAAAAAPTSARYLYFDCSQRNLCCKELATLDQLSGGRVELGLGVGWLKEEFEALGVPWERRGARNDEYIEAMKALWQGPHAEFHGDFVDFAPVTCSPRPVNGSIPIIVGGDTERAIARAGKIADGYFPGEGNIDRLKDLISRVKRSAESNNRDPESVKISAIFGAQMMNPEAGVEEMRSAGVDRIMVPAFFFAGEGGMDRLSEFGEKIIPLA